MSLEYCRVPCNVNHGSAAPGTEFKLSQAPLLSMEQVQQDWAAILDAQTMADCDESHGDLEMEDECAIVDLTV